MNTPAFARPWAVCSLLICWTVLLLPLGPLGCGGKPDVVCTGGQEVDQQLAKEVLSQLLAAGKLKGPAGCEWPPHIVINQSDEINAGAVRTKTDGNPVSYRTRIELTTGLLKAIDTASPGGADRLAFVLGHELQHFLLGHFDQAVPDVPFADHVFTQEQEFAADREGMKLALHANYSYRRCLEVADKMIDAGHGGDCWHSGVKVHPSWKARREMLESDPVKASLWHAMNSFDTGVVFLEEGDYRTAEICFRRVIEEFPDCYEAWANVGYARLMMYCAHLSVEELRQLDVGQLVVAGFYRRPESLLVQRDVKDWEIAVEALEKA